MNLEVLNRLNIAYFVVTRESKYNVRFFRDGLELPYYFYESTSLAECEGVKNFLNRQPDVVIEALINSKRS